MYLEYFWIIVIWIESVLRRIFNIKPLDFRFAPRTTIFSLILSVSKRILCIFCSRSIINPFVQLDLILLLLLFESFFWFDIIKNLITPLSPILLNIRYAFNHFNLNIDDFCNKWLWIYDLTILLNLFFRSKNSITGLRRYDKIFIFVYSIDQFLVHVDHLC